MRKRYFKGIVMVVLFIFMFNINTTLIAEAIDKKSDELILNIENPEENHNLTGDFFIKGHAISEVGIKKIWVQIDDKEEKEVKYGLERKDIQNKYPNNINSLNSGYEITISGIEAGKHKINVFAENENGEIVEKSININVDTRLTEINGIGKVNSDKMKHFLYDNHKDKYSNAEIDKFVDYTIEESNLEKINYEVVFALMMHETNYLNFEETVDYSKNNFGKLKNIDEQAVFKDMKTGIRAVVQRLKAYSSSDNLKGKYVDENFKDVKRSSIKYLEHLGIKENPYGIGWSEEEAYGLKIKNIMKQVSSYKIEESKLEKFNVKCDSKVGKKVTLEAISNFKSDTIYKFSVKKNNKWEVISDKQGINKIEYKPNIPGKYEFKVEIKNKNSKNEIDDKLSSKIYDVKNDIKTILIDPGHGSGNNKFDNGDMGSQSQFNGKNYIESKLNIEIANKLKKSLINKGYKVIMTRTNMSDDMNLKERASYGNLNGVDLVVSIHQNSFYNQSAHGVEVLVDSSEMDKDYRDELLNNGFEDPKNTYKTKIKNSENLAKQVVDNISNATKFYNRGVKNQRLTILRNSKSPAILVECGFLYNKDQVEKLANSGFQDKIASSISEAIVSYDEKIKDGIGKNSKPVINAKDLTIKLGSNFDYKKGVTANDKEDGNLTSKIKVKGTVNTKKVGKYNVEYEVTDKYGNTAIKKIVVTVQGEFKVLTINSLKTTSTSITGKGENGATVKAYIDGKQIGKTATVNSKGDYKISIPKQKAGKKVVVKMSKSGYVTKETSTVVKNVFKTFTMSSLKTTSTSITGKGTSGATVKAYVDGKQIGKTATVNSKGSYKISIPKQKAGKKVVVKMSKSGYVTTEKSTVVKNVFKTFTVSSIKKTSTSITGKGTSGATVKAYVNGKQIGKTATVNSKGSYKISIPKQKARKKVVVKMSKSGYVTMEKSITVK